MLSFNNKYRSLIVVSCMKTVQEISHMVLRMNASTVLNQIHISVCNLKLARNVLWIRAIGKLV